MRTLDGRADLPVVPDGGVKGEQALNHAGPQTPAGTRPPWRSRPSWFFRVQDDCLDPLAQFGLARQSPVAFPPPMMSSSMAPQYQREWLGAVPSSRPHPNRPERRVVMTECPHGMGRDVRQPPSISALPGV